MKKYTGYEFSSLVATAILNKTNKTKLDLLNNGFYCIVGVETKEVYPYYGKSIMIDGKKRKNYQDKNLSSFPNFYQSEREYAFERNYRHLLDKYYDSKKNPKVLLFEDNDSYLFDEIIEYIVDYELAAEINSNIDDFDRLSLIEKISNDIWVKQGSNMKQFCHVFLDKSKYNKLRSIKDIVDYFADKVIETIEDSCLLIAVDLKYLSPKTEFKSRMELLLAELTSNMKLLNEITSNEFLKDNENAKKASCFYQESVSCLNDIILNFS